MGRIDLGRDLRLDEDQLEQTAGGTISSANTVAPTNGCHVISGTALIKTITPPSWLVPGNVLKFIPQAAFTTDTTGNIAKVSTAVANQVMFLVWDGTKFYPSY